MRELDAQLLNGRFTGQIKIDGQAAGGGELDFDVPVAGKFFACDDPEERIVGDDGQAIGRPVAGRDAELTLFIGPRRGGVGGFLFRLPAQTTLDQGNRQRCVPRPTAAPRLWRPCAEMIDHATFDRPVFREGGLFFGRFLDRRLRLRGKHRAAIFEPTETGARHDENDPQQKHEPIAAQACGGEISANV